MVPWYVTVQLIVLADSGYRVYARPIAQYANHIHVWGEAPHESREVWNKVPDPFLRKGVARETTLHR